MKTIKKIDKYLGKRYLSWEDRNLGIDILESKFPMCPTILSSPETNTMTHVIGLSYYTPLITLKYLGKRYDVAYYKGEFIWSEFMHKEGYTGTIDELVEFVTNDNQE